MATCWEIPLDMLDEQEYALFIKCKIKKMAASGQLVGDTPYCELSELATLLSLAILVLHICTKKYTNPEDPSHKYHVSVG